MPHESGLYYLQSRYYNPEIGRFINADSLVSTGQGVLGYNMFAYCGNNPVNRDDSTGQFWNIVAGAVTGAVISATIQVVTNLLCGKEWHDGVALAVASGAITGGFAATGVPILGQAAISGSVSAIAEAIYQCGNEDDFDPISVGAAFVGGFAAGLMGGDGIRLKGGTLANAQNLCDYVKAGVQVAKWAGSKGSKYFDLATKTLHKVLVKEIHKTTLKYAGGGAMGMAVKELLNWAFD